MRRASSAEPAPSVGASLDDARGRRQAAPLQDKAISLWLWVAAGFLALVVAWTVLFTVARSVRVESVPLAAKEAKP